MRFYKWQPSSDLSYYTAYLRLGGPLDDLLSLVSGLGLHRKGSEGALPYLPTGWQTHQQVDLDWWDASPETPPESWAAPFGVAGRIVAKIEGGRLHAIATDTGRREDVP